MTETQFIDPAKAISPLGQAIARLLQASGLEIDIDAFGEIDAIAITLKSLQAQLIELDRAQESDKEEMSDRIEQIEDAPGQSDINDLKARLSSLEDLCKEIGKVVEYMRLEVAGLDFRVTCAADKV